MSENNSNIKPLGDYHTLLQNVGIALEKGRNQAAYAVNSIMVKTYWEIGQDIVEYEQAGNARAEYGTDVLNRLSKDLTARYGKGFSRGNVHYMRKLFLAYPKIQTLSELLTWSHYVELLKIDDCHAIRPSKYLKSVVCQQISALSAGTGAT